MPCMKQSTEGPAKLRNVVIRGDEWTDGVYKVRQSRRTFEEENRGWGTNKRSAAAHGRGACDKL